MTIEELEQQRSYLAQQLRELAPYNGTVPGARAIADTRTRLEGVERELKRRLVLDDQVRLRYAVGPVAARTVGSVVRVYPDDTIGFITRWPRPISHRLPLDAVELMTEAG